MSKKWRIKRKRGKTMEHGYKVFDKDWTCKGFQYAVGQTYKMNEKPVCCVSGFHYCVDLIDCFNYYCFSPENKVARIVALGDIDGTESNSKRCTNEIKICEELSWAEVLQLVNTGSGNSGHSNSGCRNSGCHNSGHGNAGFFNSGNSNSGCYNGGHFNTGDYNSGKGNSGNFNSGNFNSGDFNCTNYSSGCFNTKEDKLILFNKPSEWTRERWDCSIAKVILKKMPIDIKLSKWNELTEEQKKVSSYGRRAEEFTEKVYDNEERQKWWDELTDWHRGIIKSIPNFDPDIFYECTGIRVKSTE